MKAVYRDRQALRDVNTCGICGKDFLTRGDLVGHMRTHEEWPGVRHDRRDGEALGQGPHQSTLT